MDERGALGERGEAAVAAALERRGFRVLERRYRCRWGEIDLIVRSPEGVLCFVEVKTRSPGAIAAARESVTPAKQRRLRAAPHDPEALHTSFFQIGTGDGLLGGKNDFKPLYDLLVVPAVRYERSRSSARIFGKPVRLCVAGETGFPALARQNVKTVFDFFKFALGIVEIAHGAHAH